MPSSPDLATAARRADLLALLAVDPRFEAERAACVARWLDARPRGEVVALFGCGGLGRRLARSHAPSLRRLAPVFVSTKVESGGFEGFPATDAADLARRPPPAVLLLSATYEDEMRRALPGMPPERILSLRQVLPLAALDTDLPPLWRAMQARAGELSQRLERELPPGAPAVCFLLSNFGNHALEVLAQVRQAGWTVVAATHAAPPGPEAALRARGQLDLLHAEPSPEALRLVLAALLAQAAPFRAVHAWTSFSNHGFLADLVRAGTPLVAAVDAALPPVMDSAAFAETLCAELGVDRETLLADWRTVYTGAAGVISKDSPALAEHFQRERGAVPRRMLHQLPPVGPAPGPDPARARRQGPVRLACIASLHRTARRAGLFNIPDFLDMVRGFTTRGFSLTAINNLDSGTGGWADLEDLARTEPLFDYRPRVAFEDLPRVLADFDFGLLWHHPRLSARLPLVHATNLQTKLLVHVQADLPSLVPAELSWCAEVARAMGLGLVFSHADMDNLGTMLASFDRERCLAALAAARARLGVKAHAARLAAFLREATDDFAPPGPDGQGTGAAPR
ncbi:MAG: hypothetical protein KKA55_00715 [Proteobacteria bacterium]|nr:hypothetical protein [Pseudomonadota bacterium]MBU1594038.1 hypothetical protein [Pseudomonadota bacterium]